MKFSNKKFQQCLQCVVLLIPSFFCHTESSNSVPKLFAQRLRGGVSKYYNTTAPSLRGGIFEEPKAGVPLGDGQSLWNKGGWSFEERDHTEFCKARLLSFLSDIRSPFRFSNLTSVRGHALVTYRQGRKSAGVNWDELTLTWNIGESGSEEEATGTLTIKEFYSDFPEDIELFAHVSKSGNGKHGTALELRSALARLKQEFTVILGKLVNEMLAIRSKA